LTPHDFCTWLKGVADALGDEPPNAERWERIKKQLDEVGKQPAPPAQKAQPAPSLQDLLDKMPKMTPPSKWWRPRYDGVMPYRLEASDFPPGTIVCGDQPLQNGAVQ
jgi:hypothetical protein